MPHSIRRMRGGARGGGFHDPFDIFREVFGGGGTGSIFDDLFGGTAGAIPQRPNAGAICAMIWRSLLKKRPMARKRKSPSPSRTAVRPATAPAEPVIQGQNLPHLRRPRPDHFIARHIQHRANLSACQGAGRIIENPCSTCHGTGRREQTTKIKLRIPAGVDTGSRLRSSGNGEAGVRGGPAGDLYVVLHVKPHEIFQRDGDDLICEVPIGLCKRLSGQTSMCPLSRAKLEIKIPPGNPERNRLPPQRQRCQKCSGLRSRRSARANQCRSSHSSECRAESQAPGICRALRRKGKSDQP